MTQKITRRRKIPPLIAGNWKMNGTQASLRQIDRLIAGLAKQADKTQGHKSLAPDILICPPATLLAPMAARVKAAGSRQSRIILGGQDCHAAPSGAHTGDISASMLRDAGARAVIVGHSERRTDYGETNRQIREKATTAQAAGLAAIICIGETLQQRRAKATLRVIGQQLRNSLPIGGKARATGAAGAGAVTAQNTIIAYEPVWAIGTGLTPTIAQVAQVHASIRATLKRRFGAGGADIRILYGGSVKPENAAQLLAIDHVNGALIGGASLKATDFLKIIAIAQKTG